MANICKNLQYIYYSMNMAVTTITPYDVVGLGNKSFVANITKQKIDF